MEEKKGFLAKLFGKKSDKPAEPAEQSADDQGQQQPPEQDTSQGQQ